jgi:hypothetical protein
VGTPKSRRFDTDSDEDDVSPQTAAAAAAPAPVEQSSSLKSEEGYAWSCCLSTAKLGKGCVGRVIARPDAWNLED